MTLDDFVALAPRVGFHAGALCWNPHVEIQPEMNGGARIRVRKFVPDRELLTIDTSSIEALAPQMISAASDYFVYAWELEAYDEPKAIARLLEAVLDALVHEVHESIRFDGKIVRDDHAGERKR